MSLKYKIMLCLISLISLLFGLGGGLLIHTSFEQGIEQKRETVQRSYEMVMQTLCLVNQTSKWDSNLDVTETLEQIYQSSLDHASIRLGNEQEIIFRKGEHETQIQDLQEETTDSRLVSRLFAASEGQRFLQVSGMFYLGEDPLYLDLLTDVTDLYEMRGQQQKYLFQIMSLIIALAVVISLLIGHMLTQNLRQLSQSAKRIAGGELEHRCEICSEDETGILAQEFNRMADVIVGHINDLDRSLEQKNQFIENFTHELKTPMTSIIGFADLLRSQSLSEAEQLEAANYIFSEGKRLEALSLKLLSIFVSDHKQICFQTIHLEQELQGMIGPLTTVYQKDRILVSLVCEEIVCEVDRDLFRSLLLNLMENARRAMPDGGEIVIRGADDGETYQLIVEDNGRGIPEDSLLHITEAFYRVDKARSREQGGAGLGLTLCEKIVNIHQGNIFFESKPEEGTRVICLLSKHPQKERKEEAKG